MEPAIVEPNLYFTAYAQLDTGNMTFLSLFAGSTGANYSNSDEMAFDFSRDGVNLSVMGDEFVYADGVPISGIVISMEVKVGNATALTFATFSVGDVDGLPMSIFVNADPQTLAYQFFAGNDIINGSRLADRIHAFDGDDMISGGDGDDRLFGDDGDDQIYGGSGVDVLYGGAGDDWLSGGKGNDKLIGGAGVDTAVFSDKLAPVVVKLRGEGKTTKAKIGFNEVDKLKGIENVLGGLGKDTLTGNKLDNVLGGYAGDDFLSGKGGNDTLIGGFGSDTLTGGKGSDIFLFNTIPAGSSFTDVDTIKDFEAGIDKIHFDEAIFGALDAGVLSADNFLVGPGVFAGNGETYIIYDSTNGVLYYDPSGDGSDYVFQVAILTGAPTLTASDIFVRAAPLIDV